MNRCVLLEKLEKTKLQSRKASSGEDRLKIANGQARDVSKGALPRRFEQILTNCNNY
jgi:hypothetical protein